MAKLLYEIDQINKIKFISAFQIFIPNELILMIIKYVNNYNNIDEIKYDEIIYDDNIYLDVDKEKLIYSGRKKKYIMIKIYYGQKNEKIISNNYLIEYLSNYIKASFNKYPHQIIYSNKNINIPFYNIEMQYYIIKMNLFQIIARELTTRI